MKIAFASHARILIALIAHPQNAYIVRLIMKPKMGNAYQIVTIAQMNVPWTVRFVIMTGLLAKNVHMDTTWRTGSA